MDQRNSKRYFLFGAFAVSLLTVLGSWFWAWWVLRATPGLLIFSDYTGITQIGTITQIHQWGATGVIMVLVNFFLAQSLPSKYSRLGDILAGSTVFLAALLFMGLAAIISVNQ